MYQSIECGAVPRAAAPLAARRSSNSGVLRAIVAVFAVSAFCGSLISGGAPSRAHDVDATTALTADVRSFEAGFFTDEEQLVVDVLLGSSAPDFHLNCSSTTFAPVRVCLGNAGQIACWSTISSTVSDGRDHFRNV